jgi:enamine deaminase RidA (YjgF/YER057c/UK114 family)
MPFELIDPKGVEAPVGYAHVAKITGGTVVHIAGQAPFDERGQVVGKGDFVAHFTQVMENLKTAVEAAGGRPNQYAVLTIYITNLEAYWENKKPLGTAYRQIFGKYFPAITLVEVKRLYNPTCMIEISGVAVID